MSCPKEMRGLTDDQSVAKPGFRQVTHRAGPWCTPAFAITNCKSQGKTFRSVLLNLKGPRSGSGQAGKPAKGAAGDAAPASEGSKPSLMSVYFHVSRAVL